MRPFSYVRANVLAQASRLGSGTVQGATDAPVQFLAGGTTLLDLMKLDVLRPTRVVDLAPLASGLNAVKVGANGLQLGALVKMSSAADHPQIRAHYPVIAMSPAL